VSPYLVSHVSHDFVHSELLLLCDPETAVLSRSTDISLVKIRHGVISQKTGNSNFGNISVSQRTVNHYYSKIIKNRPTAYRNNLHFVLTKLKAIYTKKCTSIRNTLSHLSHEYSDMFRSSFDHPHGVCHQTNILVYLFM